MKQSVLTQNTRTSPVLLRKPAPTSDFGSPRFARTNNDQKNNAWLKKTPNKAGTSSRICYISPKKVLQHPDGGCKSYQSLSRSPNYLANLGPPVKGSNKSEDTSFSEININIKGDFSKVHQNAKQRVMKTKTISQQNIQLSKKNCQLVKMLSSKTIELEKVKASLKEVLTKFEELTGLLENKDSIIQRLQESLHENELMLLKLQNSVNEEKEEVDRLKQYIDTFHKSGEDNRRCSCCVESLSETQDDEKQRLEREVNKYKNEVLSLNYKLKYINLQDSMLEKIKFDLEAEKQKNERLKKQNKKLLVKVQTLVKEAEKRTMPRWKIQTPKSLTDSQISLSFSPEK